MQKVCVVIPNWNGKDSIGDCLDSLLTQLDPSQIIVVDNGSTDGSVDFLETNYPELTLIRHSTNEGFAGGVNAGLRYALEQDYKYVALLNNDAIARKDWLKHLVAFLDNHPRAGIVTSKITDGSGNHLDSTGDIYTTWGLSYPRGRGEPVDNKYDEQTWVFGASGGASLYRTTIFREIGLFDEDFFAYYEDVDLSFRAQLAGWKVAYEPRAVVWHQIGATSSKIKDFTTYQTMKNYPMLLWKNVPWPLILKVLPRFSLAYLGFYISALRRGQAVAATKGLVFGLLLLPKKLGQRYKIQKTRKVTVEYISSILVYDLPPNAHKLRKLRAIWWKAIGKDVKS